MGFRIPMFGLLGLVARVAWCRDGNDFVTFLIFEINFSFPFVGDSINLLRRFRLDESLLAEFIVPSSSGNDVSLFRGLFSAAETVPVSGSTFFESTTD
jgi:hypothetical protein